MTHYLLYILTVFFICDQSEWCSISMVAVLSVIIVIYDLKYFPIPRRQDLDSHVPVASFCACTAGLSISASSRIRSSFSIEARPYGTPTVTKLHKQFLSFSTTKIFNSRRLNSQRLKLTTTKLTTTKTHIRLSGKFSVERLYH